MCKGALVETGNLDDTATVLDTELVFSSAMEDTTPMLAVLEGAATVEGCSDTLVDDWIVAFWETTKLDDTLIGLDIVVVDDWLVAFGEATKLDASPTPTELDVGTNEVFKRALVDCSNADVFTAETVWLRLGILLAGKEADESPTVLV